MTLTIEVTDEEAARLSAAGVDVTTLVKGVAASLPGAADPTRGAGGENAAAVAFFEERLRRMEGATPEELTQGDREVAEFLEGLDRNRSDAGERPLFPG